MSLVQPLTRMTRLWNDGIIQSQAVKYRLSATKYAAGMSQLPSTLTHVSLRIHRPWWNDGHYQKMIASWPSLTRLELYFHADIE